MASFADHAYKTVVIGLVSGAVFGVFLGNALRRGWIPGYLQNFAVLSFVLLTFGVSNTLADESGLLAVTVRGSGWLICERLRPRISLNLKKSYPPSYFQRYLSSGGPS